MNKEAQRVAIAEACGWRDVRLSLRWEASDPPDDPIVLCGIGPLTTLRLEIPDYLFDLNAMHEAEKVLSMEQASNYGWYLAEIADRLVEFHEDVQIGPLDIYVWATLTAAQRAEAFLKTLGKWQEAK